MNYAPKLTHEQRHERRKQMVEMLAGGASDVDVASRFGVSFSLVQQCRRNRGLLTPKWRETENLRQIVLRELRAGNTVKSIREKLGVNLNFVYTTARKAGIKPQKPSRVADSVVTQDEWKNVDWTKRDIDLSKLLGVTRERVRQVRQKLGKPRAEIHRMHRNRIEITRWAKDNREAISGLTLTDITAMAPFKASAALVRVVCDKLGITVEQKKSAAERITCDNVKDFVRVADSGCWEWLGGVNRKTGRAMLSNGIYAAHRSYELFHGPIPTGLWVLHTCDNTLCINPDHIYAGTPKDNALDRQMRGRSGKEQMTPDQVCRVRLLRVVHGWTIQKIADEIGVKHGAISKVLSGQTHSWVPDGLAI